MSDYRIGDMEGTLEVTPGASSQLLHFVGEEMKIDPERLQEVHSEQHS